MRVPTFAASIAAGLALMASPLAQGPQTPQAPAPAAPILSPGPSAARYPITNADFDAYFQKVKNWGRWGANDEIGRAHV